MKSRIVLGAWAAALAAVLFLSDRPWGMTSSYRIAEIAVLPDDARLASVRRYTEIGSGVIPYVGSEAPPVTGARPPLRLGWLYSEFSAFRMPFWASSDAGMVTYVDTPYGRQFAIITEGQKPLLDRMAGSPVTQGYRFRWYFLVWGWLFLAGLIVWTWLRRREDLAREEAHWNS